MHERFGSTLVAEVLKGSQNKKVIQFRFDLLSTYGLMKEYTLKEIKDMINVLIAEGYIYSTEGQYPVVKICPKALPVLKGEGVVWQKIRKKQVQLKQDESLFEQLRALRKEISAKENVPPYVVFPDSTLREMCSSLPTDSTSMLAVKGVGEIKFQNYGSRFIEVINSYVNEHNLSPGNNRTRQAVLEDECSPNNNRQDEGGEGDGEDEPSHLTTYKMYQAGQPVSEIAKERSLKPVTIENHIIRSGFEGHPVDWDAIIPQEHENLILDTIRDLGAEKLRPLKDALPDEISYFAIRAVMCKYEIKAGPGC